MFRYLITQQLSTLLLKSVNNIENPYTLRILKLDEADYGMLVKVQRYNRCKIGMTIENVYSESELPTYQTESSVTAIFTNVNNTEYYAVVGAE